MNLNVKGENMSLWSRPSSDDKQDRLLKSMESSLKSIFSISRDIRNNSYTQSILLDSITTRLDEISLNVQNLSQSITGTYAKLSHDFSRSLSGIKLLNDNMEDLLDGIEELSNQRDQGNLGDDDGDGDSDGDGDDDGGSKVSKKLDIASDILRTISRYTKEIADRTREYHDYTSDLLKYTGSGLEAVSSYRSELAHDIVGELNRDIGKQFFNSTEAYKTLTDIALSANIGSVDALREISRPVLLAESALQTDVTRIAELFNKFYLRYNFSSRSMEAMVDNILTYTADNQAQAASVAEGVYELSDEIAIYARGDEGKINTSLDNLAKSLSWVESLGQDSATYTADIDKILSGAHYTDQGLRQILEMGGLDPVTAQELARAGDFDTLIEALFTGRANWGKQLIDNPRFADILPVYGLSESELENAYGAYLSPNYQPISQFNPEAQEATESLDDHFLSWTTQFGNWASRWDESLSSLEQIVGIGFDDISWLLTAIASVIGVVSVAKSGGNILSALIGGAGSTAASGGLLGGLTKLLPALGVGAVVAGSIAAVISGIHEGVKTLAGMDEDANTALTAGSGVDVNKPIYFDITGDVDESGNPIYGLTNTITPDHLDNNVMDYAYQTVRDTNAKTGLGLDLDLNPLEVLWRVIAGSGWWGNEETPWWYKIPIFGTLAAEAEMGTVMHGYEERKDDIQDTYVRMIRYLQKDHATLYKILWVVNGSNKDYSFPKTLFDNLGNYKAYIDEGFLPTGIDESGKVTSYIPIADSPYANVDFANLPLYKEGTNYIPHDQLAYLHEGEAVVPKKFNPAADPTNLESIRERTSNLQEVSTDYYRESLTVLREVRSSLGELTEIKEFLAAWKKDNINRETIKESVSRLNYQRSTVSGYLPIQV